MKGYSAKLAQTAFERIKEAQQQNHISKQKGEPIPIAWTGQARIDDIEKGLVEIARFHLCFLHSEFGPALLKSNFDFSFFKDFYYLYDVLFETKEAWSLAVAELERFRKNSSSFDLTTNSIIDPLIKKVLIRERDYNWPWLKKQQEKENYTQQQDTDKKMSNTSNNYYGQVPYMIYQDNINTDLNLKTSPWYPKVVDDLVQKALILEGQNTTTNKPKLFEDQTGDLTEAGFQMIQQMLQKNAPKKTQNPLTSNHRQQIFNPQ